MSGFNLADPRIQRIIQAAALGLGIGLALINIHAGLLWTDGRVYWEAGERVASGGPVYVSGASPDTAFKYAPWFAWMWALFTRLPEVVVAAAWTGAMLIAWAVPIPSYLRGGWNARAVLFLASPPLLVAALGGNVQPAIIVMLFAGVERRWGPGAIGVAASLKLFPILFAFVYCARRQWARAVTAAGVGALLWLPALADLNAYP